MATQKDYTASANAILAVMRSVVADYAEKYPDIGQWEEKAADMLPGLAGRMAKASVDAVDAARAGITTGVPIMTDPTTPTAPASNDILHQVLGYLQVGCGIIAQYSAIEALISTFPGGAVAVTIANTVCDAVRATTGGRSLKFQEGPRVVTVKGIRIPIHAVPSF